MNHAGRRALIAALAAPFLLAGCGDDGGDAPASADLDGRTFVASTVEGHDLVAGSSLVIAFEDGRVAVQGGCNSMSGDYEVVDSTLSVGELAGTLMACDDPLMDQDRWVGELLSAGPAIELDGGTLTLADGGVTITLDEQG